MTFGEKLKVLRAVRDWTQPQAAQAIGVEQSYLSKLENNHSVPSAEVFARIIDAYTTTVREIVEELDDVSLAQLRQIPEVADHLAQRKHVSSVRRRAWSQGLALAVALGAALLYAGIADLFFPSVAYAYKSYGVVHAGESKEVFRGMNAEDLRNRLDERFLTSNTYRGESFSVPVEDGTRTFHLGEERQTDPWQNKLVTFLGVFFLTFGVIGLLIASAQKERR